MDRRNLLRTLPALAAATVSLPAFAQGGHDDETVDAVTAEFISAIVTETATFRNDCENEDACNAAVDRAIRAGKAVLALPPWARSHPDFLPAVALVRRRWLVMEGSYADPQETDACLLVDGVLAGTRFDDLPLLWHVDGEEFDRRPTEEEFAKARVRAEGAQ